MFTIHAKTDSMPYTTLPHHIRRTIQIIIIASLANKIIMAAWFSRHIFYCLGSIQFWKYITLRTVLKSISSWNIRRVDWFKWIYSGIAHIRRSVCTIDSFEMKNKNIAQASIQLAQQLLNSRRLSLLTPNRSYLICFSN